MMYDKIELKSSSENAALFTVPLISAQSGRVAQLSNVNL